MPSPFFQRTLSTVPLRHVVKAPKQNGIDSHYNFLTKIQIQKLRDQLEDMTAQRDAAVRKSLEMKRKNNKENRKNTIHNYFKKIPNNSNLGRENITRRQNLEFPMPTEMIA